MAKKMDKNDRRYEQLHKTQARLAMSECVNAVYIVKSEGRGGILREGRESRRVSE